MRFLVGQAVAQTESGAWFFVVSIFPSFFLSPVPFNAQVLVPSNVVVVPLSFVEILHLMIVSK